MEIFAFFGFFFLGSLFNVILIMILVKSALKSGSTEIRSVIASVKSVVEGVKKNG